MMRSEKKKCFRLNRMMMTMMIVGWGSIIVISTEKATGTYKRERSCFSSVNRKRPDLASNHREISMEMYEQRYVLLCFLLLYLFTFLGMLCPEKEKSRHNQDSEIKIECEF